MKGTIHVLIPLLLILSVGCGTTAFDPLKEKDVHLKDVTITVMSPWGQQVLHAAEIDTRLEKAKSSRPFPVLEKNIVTTTGTTNTTSTTSNPPPSAPPP